MFVINMLICSLIIKTPGIHAQLIKHLGTKRRKAINQRQETHEKLYDFSKEKNKTI